MLRPFRAGGSDAATPTGNSISRKKAFCIRRPSFLPEAKGGSEWLDADKRLLLSSAYGEGAWRLRSGYARTVRLWPARATERESSGQ